MKQLTIIGNLGYDASIKEANGHQFLEFSVAVTERYKKQDGTQVENTDWINVTYNNTKVAQYLKKGMKVLVQGKMDVNVYQAKNNGGWRSSINIRAAQIEFLSPAKPNGTNTGGPADAPAQPMLASGEKAADDLPF